MEQKLNDLELKLLRLQLIKSYVQRYKKLQIELAEITTHLNDLCYEGEKIKVGHTMHQIIDGKPIEVNDAD